MVNVMCKQKKKTLPYSGKIWLSLNLTILAKTLYFLIWRVFSLAIWSFNLKMTSPLQRKLATWIWQLATWQLAICKLRKCLATLDGPFSAPYLPLFALSFGVYSFFAWLQGETTLEHVHGVGQQFAPA